MANMIPSKSRGSPQLENYPFLFSPHPAAMNSFPTSIPLPTDRFVDHRRLKPGFKDSGPLCVYKDKPEVPLRQRQLPASFWKEPNVPRFPFPASYMGVFPSHWSQQHVEYKDFIDRLQSAELHGRINSLGSRFPITEFLYYNYGLRDRAEATVKLDCDRTWPRIMSHQCKKQHSILPVAPLQSVYPYGGCACSDSNLETINTGAETTGLPRTDLLQSSVWKPIATKTLSSYPKRFHPFAHAR